MMLKQAYATLLFFMGFSFADTAHAWKYKVSNDTSDIIYVELHYATLWCKGKKVRLNPNQKDLEISPHGRACLGACVDEVTAFGPKGKQTIDGFVDCGNRTIHVKPGRIVHNSAGVMNFYANYTFSGLHSYTYNTKTNK